MNQHVPDTARCLNCRYLLRGLPEPRCPECGQPFDPGDPDTYYDPARPKRSVFRRFIHLARPEGPHSASDLFWIVLLTLGVIWTNASIPRVFVNPLEEPACFVALVYLLLGGVIVDLIWRWRVRAKARRTDDERILDSFQRGRWRWRLAVACIVVSCVTAVYPWPVYAPFYLSWPSLRREAQACLSGNGSWVGWRRIGLYNVEYLHGHHKGCVFFQIGHRGDFRYGFSYRPSGPAPWNDRWGRHRIHWRPLLPGWYMEGW
jgi:hypothetical protein